MKVFKTLLVIAFLSLGLSASAGDMFRWGPRVGLEVNKMHFSQDLFAGENKAGITAGLMAEINVPIINVGVDLSVMYVHRTFNSAPSSENVTPDEAAMAASDSYRKRDYIEIPLNLKYKFGLPVVGKIVSPYVFTGPSFSILASKKAINNAYQNKSFDVAWNFGIGLQFFNRLQIGASYGLGITKAVERVSGYQGAEIEGKNNYWTCTAAWLF